MNAVLPAEFAAFRRSVLIGVYAVFWLFTTVDPAAARQDEPIDVRLDADQALATLDLLEARARGESVSRETWSRRVFATEGFRRVMERERGIDARLGIDRGISEESFLAWAESPAALEGLAGRRRTLAAWLTVDVDKAAGRAMAYLPDGARLQATVYPIVREQTNSFVWDLPDDPAIFLAVRSDASADELLLTMAHELHHVGLSQSCPEESTHKIGPVAEARGWLSGFGEGLAVLAAAGGPDGPTHAPGQVEIIRYWTARMDSLDTDMRRMEAFFVDVAGGGLDGEDAQRRGMAFVNSDGAPQGPFYTLGYHMAVTVEQELGHDALIAKVCRPEDLLTAYQLAARHANARGEDLPLWSESLFSALGI